MQNAPRLSQSLLLALVAAVVVAFTVTPAVAVDAPIAHNDVYTVAQEGRLFIPGNHAFASTWSAFGHDQGALFSPRDIAIDTRGNVYVADTLNHRIQKFSSNGSFVMAWGDGGWGVGQFSEPHGIAVDAAGNVYVADTNNHRIQKFTSDGVYLTQWGSFGGGDSEFRNPMGVAVDPNGDVYVTDDYNNRVQKFAADGTYLTQWGTYGTGDREFDRPQGIAIDHAGTVFVADTLNHRIQVFEGDGTYLNQWGGLGTGDGQFNVPRGVAVDAAGSVFVADTEGNHRIQKFTAGGVYLTKWGSLGSGNGEFWFPWGLTTSASGAVFVADTRNHRVQRFTPAGLLGNDIDPDGDVLTAVIENGAIHGDAIVNPDGGFSYTPEAGFVGVDSFTYYANDGAFDSNLGIVTIDVQPVGYLRVTTEPAVPSQILVEGVPRDTWGLTWVKVLPGSHEVTFTDIQGFETPDPQLVTVDVGTTTEVIGSFVLRGWLQATTIPPLPATISVDGREMNDWGVWTDLDPDSYEVCFGNVADYATPECQIVDVTVGATTQVEGVYAPLPGAPEPSGYGYLRVTTDPAVPAQILINGQPRDTWGLTWLKLPPGEYEVAYTDIQGFTTPAAEWVIVDDGATTEVTGTYLERGWMHVTTSPALPATIFANDIPRNDWGLWTDLPAAGYSICFSPVPGYATPECAGLGTIPGETTEHTGVYVPIP